MDHFVNPWQSLDPYRHNTLPSPSTVLWGKVTHISSLPGLNFSVLYFQKCLPWRQKSKVCLSPSLYALKHLQPLPSIFFLDHDPHITNSKLQIVRCNSSNVTLPFYRSSGLSFAISYSIRWEYFLTKNKDRFVLANILSSNLLLLGISLLI